MKKLTLFFVPSFDDETDTPCMYDAITEVVELPLDCATPEELFEAGDQD
jgi:hypothetical protein